MPDQLDVALVQMEARVGEVDDNIERATDLVARAAANQPDLIVLPEFFNTGYFPLYRDFGYTELAEDEQGKTITTFRKVAREHSCHIVVPIYEIEAPGLYYDTAVIVSPQGDIVGKYRKCHTPARVSLEKLYYRGASRLPVFRILGWRVGILICYDNYITEATRVLMVQGAELVIAPFAEVEGFDMWAPLLRTRAFENGIYVAACNLVGPDSEPPSGVLGGGSLISDPEGVLVAQASQTKEEILRAPINRERLISVRSRRQFIRDRRPELYNALVQSDEDARMLENGIASIPLARTARLEDLTSTFEGEGASGTPA